jgi:hypothetical protein
MRATCRCWTGKTLMGVISFYDVAKAVVDAQDFENRMLKAYIRDWPAEGEGDRSAQALRPQGARPAPPDGLRRQWPGQAFAPAWGALPGAAPF